MTTIALLKRNIRSPPYKPTVKSFKQQWFSALSQDLVTARNALDTAKAQLEKATKHQDLVRLSATEDSVVLTLAKLSVGSVLKEGDALVHADASGYAAGSGITDRFARRRIFAATAIAAR